MQDHLHSWKKSLSRPNLRQYNRYGSIFCASSVLKSTGKVPVTAPQRNPTLPWQDFHFNGNSYRSSPKHSLGGQISQICLCTVGSSHQQLHVIYQFSLIVLNMSRPTLIGIRHEVLVVVHEGMWRSAMADRMGVTCVTVNRIFWRHAATGARQVHGGSLEDHTLSRPCFVHDGPTGSLH